MKLLVCSDSLQTTSGIGHIILNIIYGLKNKYEDLEIIYCTFIGNPTSELDYKWHGEKYKELFNIMKFETCNVNNENKQKIFDDIVKRNKPELVISFVDPWYLEPIAYSDYRNTYKWITYTTFETDNYPELHYYPCFKNRTSRINIKQLLNSADINIPITDQGLSTLKRFEVKYSDIIYPGLDHEVYNKVKDLKLSRRETFGSNIEEDDFIFMTLGRNSERKRLDFSIKAFDIFLKNHVKPSERLKYKLYLHTDVNETNNSGTDLLTMIKCLNLQNNIFVPSCFKNRTELSKEELYKRYLVCDCYLSLSIGEGFGLGALDAVLCKKPLIYNVGSSVEELAGDCGLPVKAIMNVPTRNTYIEFTYPNITDAASQMSNMVCFIKNKEEEGNIYDFFIDNCNTVTKQMTWENCINSFDKEIQEVMKDYKAPSFFMRRI